MMGPKLVWLALAVVVLQVIHTEVRAAGLNRADLLANIKFSDGMLNVGGESRRSPFDGHDASSSNPGQERATPQEAVKTLRDGVLVRLKDIHGLARQASGGMGKATGAALGLARAGLKDAADFWDPDVRVLARRAATLAGSIKPCSAEKQSLRNTLHLLRLDARACAKNATATFKADKLQFTNIEELTVAFAHNVTQRARQCFGQSPLMGMFCGYQAFSDLSKGSVKLFGDASIRSLKLVAVLVDVPLKSGPCMVDAFNARTTEAAAIVTSLSQCLQDSVKNATVASA